MNEDNLPVPTKQDRPRPTDDEAAKALKELNLTDKLDVLKIKAEEIFGDWLSTPGLPQVLMAKTFHTLRQVELATEFGSDVMKDSKRSVKERAQGANLIIIAAKAQNDLVTAAMKLSRQCGVPDVAPTPANAGPDLKFQLGVTVNNHAQEEKPVHPI